MSRKKKTQFDDSLQANMTTYQHYVDRLTEFAVSMFEWKDLPDTCDARFLEMNLLKNGSVALFPDDVIGFLNLPYTLQGTLDIYNEPRIIRAYASSGYHNVTDDFVIIYDNMLRIPVYDKIEMFAKRLSLIDRVIDVNVNAQKTPVALQCTEQERMTLINLYEQYDGNQPFIFSSRDLDLENSVKSINTKAEFVAPQLYELKNKIWKEALEFFGISSITENKKERLVVSEVLADNGGTIASRFSRLSERQRAVEKINRKYGLNVSVSFRSEDNETNEELLQQESEENENPNEEIKDE